MIKELMHDPIFLAGKSEVSTKEDLQVAQDLLDTLMAHRESCVGMAANMIGVRKRIIAFLDESGRTPTYTVMLNPEIIKKDGAYDTEEGCLRFSAAPVSASDIRLSRCNIRPWRCKRARKTSPAGRHRLFSMRWIIVMRF